MVSVLLVPLEVLLLRGETLDKVESSHNGLMSTSDVILLFAFERVFVEGHWIEGEDGLGARSVEPFATYNTSIYT